MRKHGNFSRAVDELLNGKNEAQDDEPVEGAEPSVTDNVQTEIPVRMVRPVAEPAGQAIITSDMVVKGTITSTSNISISGTILGDVGSEGDVVIDGRVEGNVSIRSLFLQGGTVTGDVISAGAVVVGDNSTVNGNIKADRIEVNGKIIGNLEAQGKVIMNPKAAVEGNVAAAALSMQEGAELKGNVNVHKVD